MTAMTHLPALAEAGSASSAARRLRPLAVGVALQNLLLWVPVEKVFMTQIGFDAAAIGIVAAVYAAVVPLLEVPFGVLADRWSRTRVLVLATIALAASSLVGGLSDSPAMYAVAAVLLGVYFALNSGIADSIVYDTLVEETGTGEGYEAGSAGCTSSRRSPWWPVPCWAEFLPPPSRRGSPTSLTVPLVAVSAIAFLRCREPHLHRAAERVSYRRQTATTLRTLAGGAALRRVVLLSAVTAIAAQVLFEFGPLWLVAAHAPAELVRAVLGRVGGDHRGSVPGWRRASISAAGRSSW